MVFAYDSDIHTSVHKNGVVILIQPMLNTFFLTAMRSIISKVDVRV